MNEKARAIALRASTVGAGTLAMLPAVALAEGETTSGTVPTGITEMASTVAADGIATVNAVLPVVAPLLAAIIVVGIGLKVIKRVSGRG